MNNIEYLYKTIIDRIEMLGVAKINYDQKFKSKKVRSKIKSRNDVKWLYCGSHLIVAKPDADISRALYETSLGVMLRKGFISVNINNTSKVKLQNLKILADVYGFKVSIKDNCLIIEMLGEHESNK